jgi:hypothetical protein
MALTGDELTMFSDLGSSSAVRLSDLMDIASDALRLVLQKLHHERLDALAAADRKVALDAMVTACERRWRIMERVTETRRK